MTKINCSFQRIPKKMKGLVLWIVAFFGLCISQYNCKQISNSTINPLVMLQAKNHKTGEFSLTCTGRFVTDQWVLTAANCLPSSNNTESIAVLAWLLHVNKWSVLEVAHFTAHPQASPHIKTYNIGLVKVKEPAILPEPRLLLGVYRNPTNMYESHLGMAGYGKLLISDLHDKGAFVHLNHMHSDYCQKDAQFDTKRQFCAKTNNRRNLISKCVGFSGSPVFQGHHHYEWLLVAVFTDEEPCHRRGPIALTPVANYIDWISNVTGRGFHEIQDGAYAF